MSPILDSIGSVKAFGWGKILSSTAYESIATSTVGSGGSSYVEFTSIPQTFTHLQIRGIARSTFNNGSDGVGLVIQFNSDTTTNYGEHHLDGDGSSATAGATINTATPQPNISAGSGLGANIFGASVIDILDYKNTNKYKTVRGLTGYDNNGSGRARLASSLWRSSSAVTGILLKPGGTGNFVQYSSFALYGIKGE